MTKKIIPLLLLLMLQLHAVCDEVCHILYVQGNVWRNNNQLQSSDTISFKHLEKLRFDKGSFLTIFNSNVGTIKLTESNCSTLKYENNNFADFVKSLAGIKGERVSLYSRGECTCVGIEPCFFNDKNISSNILLFSEFSFEPTADVQKIYFIQFENNGKLVNEYLETRGKKQVIKKEMFLKHTDYQNLKQVQVTLGSYYVANDKKIFESLSEFIVLIYDENEIKQYLKSLVKVNQGMSRDLILDEFYYGVYRTFGKPDKCEIERLSQNEM